MCTTILLVGCSNSNDKVEVMESEAVSESIAEELTENETEEVYETEEVQESETVKETESNMVAENDQEKGKNTITVYGSSNGGGFSIEIPVSWDGLYEAEQITNGGFNGLEFTHTKTVESGWGGHLFTVLFVSNSEKRDGEIIYPAYAIVRQTGEGDFIFLYPSDVQFSLEDDGLRDEYKRMVEERSEIEKSFKLAD